VAWSQASASQNAIAKEKLVTLPFYMVFDHVTFRVASGTVTLAGQVTRATLKSDAEKAVKQIPGLRSGNNEIEVWPVSEVDQKLRLAEYLAVFGDAQLKQYALPLRPRHCGYPHCSKRWRRNIRGIGCKRIRQGRGIHSGRHRPWGDFGDKSSANHT